MNPPAGAPSPGPARWRWQHVQQAPHRLAFLLASAVLGTVSLWWALVQSERSGLGVALTHAVPASLVHAAAMSFGFMPLFFAGFLFTAGPRWLHVPGPGAPALLRPLLAQAAGWLAWIAGSATGTPVAVLGLVLATGGLGAITARFWRLVRASRMGDRLHAQTVGTAFAIGCACHAALALAVALGAHEVARRIVLTGLWGFVVVVFVTVADRMIPFFGAGVLPGFDARHPRAMLGLTLALCALEAIVPWVAPTSVVVLVRGAITLVGGLALLALAFAWAWQQKARDRLLRMLLAGFAWLGLSFVLQGAADLGTIATGALVLPLAGLHALTMGCLGTLMLTMVSRVTCGHSGRPRVVDGLLWLLFWLLQAAVVLRIAATLSPAHAQALLTLAAWLWAALMLAWGLRHIAWYGEAARYDDRAARANPRPQRAARTPAPPP